jgi:anthranilate synthase/aminodeoxychorismate synthase-like glutamine amidotransferase
MLLIIDNYDSFTFNLYQMLGAIHPSVEVVRNDRIDVEEIEESNFEGIVLSPGPGTPDDSGICLDVLLALEGTLPILGVCLGHQAICQARGGRIQRAIAPIHGKTSVLTHDGEGLFSGAEEAFVAGRYHSLVVAPETLASSLKVTARSAEGEIMGVRHEYNPTWGVQFHPESILTPQGDRLLANFVRMMKEHNAS